LVLGIFDNQSFSNQDAYEFYKTKLKTPVNQIKINAKYLNKANFNFESEEKSVNNQYQKQYENEVNSSNPYYYQTK